MAGEQSGDMHAGKGQLDTVEVWMSFAEYFGSREVIARLGTTRRAASTYENRNYRIV